MYFVCFGKRQSCRLGLESDLNYKSLRLYLDFTAVRLDIV